MSTEKTNEMYSAGKLASELGISLGKVKKFIETQAILPDDIKRNCKYYGPETLERLRSGMAEK